MLTEKRINVTRSSMPLYEEYIEAIKPLWDTHWLTNMGKYHAELEEQLRAYLGVSELSLMVNGHMALEMAIQMMGFPRGGEVITTPYTFISTIHAIVRNGLEPVFCDIKPRDATIDETKIENLITDKTVAILPVHVYGNICNVEEIQRIADKHNLKVIYDAAHAFGIKYKNKGVGSFGDASIFSFHATKVFNTIEGGAVTFEDHLYYEKLYNLKNFGIQNEELVVDIGANAKMNEFCAVMGLCNLRHIDSALHKRKEHYDLYTDGIKNISGIRLLEHDGNATMNYSYFPIIVEDSYPLDRNQLFKRFTDKNIFPRKYFYPIAADQECFKDKYKSNELNNARRMADKVMILPLYEDIGEEVTKTIIEIIQGGNC
ncbi:MAG: DegT/DnrJ/EryC1/StrS family aminotransferase [Ruminococcus flavefaciens]|nr:DegT/DnrJ/EryC1/StrS family aminotransferase [Ruminococcus flavefaciens]